MLSVLDGHLTGPADAEDGGGALCSPPESAASPPHQCFLKAYSHMAPEPRSPAEVRQGNKLLLCWQAQNLPVPTYSAYCELSEMDSQEGIQPESMNY